MLVGAALGAVLLTVFALAFLIKGGEKEDKAWAFIQEKGMLRVGLDPSYPPFEDVNQETGEISGYDVELAREIGRRMGVEVEFVVAGFDGLYDALRARRFEAIISALPYDPRLTQDVRYTVPYFDAGQVLVVREKETEIKGLSDLAGKKLAVELGSTGDLEARRLQRQMEGLDLRPLPTPLDALWALKNGEVEAALVDSISAYHFIKYESGARICNPPVVSEPYVVAVHRESAVLWTAINSALLEMEADGTLDALRDKWL